MQLERNCYFPGEIIKGIVIFNVYKHKNIRGIRIRFDGYSKNEWSEQHTEGFGDNRRVVTYHYMTKITYFNPIATLYGNERGSNKKFQIEVGQYAFPFQFVIPMGIPPTYNGQYGKNYYEVRAYVDIPGAPDLKVHEEINMFVQYNSLSWTPNVAYSKKARNFTGKLPIRVVTTTTDIIYIGQRKPIHVQVFNESHKDIKELEVRLDAKTTFFAELNGVYGSTFNTGLWGYRRYAHLSKRHTKEVILKTKLQGLGFPIPSGGMWEGDILLDVPDDIYPSLPKEISPITHRKHRLVVKAITEGNIFTKAESKTGVQILVGKMHPYNERFNAPSEPMGTPYQIRVGQVEDFTMYNQYLYPPPVGENDISRGSLSGNADYVYDDGLFNNGRVPEQWFDDHEVGDNWALQQQRQN